MLDYQEAVQLCHTDGLSADVSHVQLSICALSPTVFLFPHLGAVFLACVGTHLGYLALCSKCVPLVPTAPWPQAKAWPNLGQPNTAVFSVWLTLTYVMAQRAFVTCQTVILRHDAK